MTRALTPQLIQQPPRHFAPITIQGNHPLEFLPRAFEIPLLHMRLGEEPPGVLQIGRLTGRND